MMISYHQLKGKAQEIPVVLISIIVNAIVIIVVNNLYQHHRYRHLGSTYIHQRGIVSNMVIVIRRGISTCIQQQGCKKEPPPVLQEAPLHPRTGQELCWLNVELGIHIYVCILSILVQLCYLSSALCLIH